MSRSVTVRVSKFVGEAAGEGEPEDLAARVVEAIERYLEDKGSGKPGWAYPSFLPERTAEGAVKLRLRIDEALWQSLEEEAARQGVSAQQMAAHAAMYAAAGMDGAGVLERVAGGIGGG